MEDKIDKLFDLVEKMHIDLKGDINGVKVDIKGLQEGQKRLEDGQKKLEITQEQMQKRLEQLAEIQQNNYEENKREHKEIIDRLKKIETATLENEAEIYNIKKAK